MDNTVQQKITFIIHFITMTITVVHTQMCLYIYNMCTQTGQATNPYKISLSILNYIMTTL